MSTLSRATGKALLSSESNFNAVSKMVERAVDKVNPTLVKSLDKNRVKMDEYFLELSCCFDRYKADIISNEGISEGEFNEEEGGVAKYRTNDKWMEEYREKYYTLVEASDEKLEDMAPVKDSEEGKVNVESEKKVQNDKRISTSLLNQLEMITESISSTIDKLTNEVKDMKDGGESLSKINSFQSVLHGLESKLSGEFNELVDKLICVLPEHEVGPKELERKTYVKKERLRLENLQLMLLSKVKEDDIAFPKSTTSPEKKEQTYLKKCDPPKWGGDPVEFAEFSRKWKAQVHTAKLPEETELDRLRESIPVQASKALYGEKSVDKAWKVLESLYGDKDLIANKLKSQLKNIKGKGKSDYDIVMDLVTEVNNIVLRLKAIDMEEIPTITRLSG